MKSVSNLTGDGLARSSNLNANHCNARGKIASVAIAAKQERRRMLGRRTGPAHKIASRAERDSEMRKPPFG
ncbi:hypothetical protein CR492_00530 [Methylocella silvestris]|uniref:Uncharacterized protein n=1 Tax=Methylocella silvestris TaxID=199596 RepID=A0A2J7TL17_METSI|nr:hypothetical protein CR492_00530 [Methylocella silvestris]